MSRTIAFVRCRTDPDGRSEDHRRLGRACAAFQARLIAFVLVVFVFVILAAMNILVAVDGSPQALRAVAYAADLLRQMPSEGVTVTLITVHDDIGYRYAETFVGRDTVAQYLRDLALTDLKGAEKILDEVGIPFRVEIRTGHVAREIVDFAAAGAFDLIVLGAKGRSALADLLVGSVAQRVLATASQSVLLVR